MKKKIFWVFGLMGFVLLLDACNGIDCNCGPYIPFFDFDEVDVFTEIDTVKANQNFEFRLLPLDLEFFAELPERPCRKPLFIATANACSCIVDGNDGMKFPVEEISLTSNSNWADSLTAGTDLSDLLLLDVRMIGDFKPANEQFDEQYFFNAYSFSIFRIEERPTADSLHVLTLEFTKSNNEKIIVELPEMVWE